MALLARPPRWPAARPTGSPQRVFSTRNHRNRSTHEAGVNTVAIPQTSACPSTSGPEQIYEQFFGFVWRNLRRLGVPDAALDDATQDVFVVVFRQWEGFEGRSSVQTWLFGIVLRVARDHRKVAQRRGRHLMSL